MPRERRNGIDRLHKGSRMNCRFQKYLTMTVTVAALLLFTGCGEKKCHFVAPDAEGLETGAPVVWYDATIGSVSDVKPDGDGVRVDVAFDSRHAKSVHDGVTAWIVNDEGVSAKPIVKLFGGRDEDRPVLKNGVRIPAPRPGTAVERGFMRFDDWLSGKNETYVAALVGILAFLKFFGKRIGVILRRLVLLILLALIAYIICSARTDWQAHRDRFSNLKEQSREAADWLIQHGEKVKALAPLVEDDGD